MRKKWEESNKLYGSSTLPRGFKSAPKFKQPGYQDLDRLLSGDRGRGGSRVSLKNWNNVVTSPTPGNRDHVTSGSVDSGRSEEGSERRDFPSSERRMNFESGRMGGTLPAWARNGTEVIDDDLNYDDVVVV